MTGAALHVVVVGNSVAGMEAAILLRNREPDLRISVVSDEHDHLFARTALMYVFCGQLSLRDTEPYDRELYARMRFLRVRDRVVALRPAERRLQLASGGELAYDRLLLAVGSKARPLPTPGADGPGVHRFVTLRDMEALDAAARPGMRVAVIGGGLIGIEVAEVLHHRGCRVHLLVREASYFPIALDANEAAVVAEHVRAHGVDVRLNANVREIARGPGGGVAGVVLDGGERLDVDLVVGTIGVVPNTAFLEDSGLALSPGMRAIEVDDALRAGVSDVWAAGDCANVAWIDGSRRPEQLWYTARDQGRAAARSILGDDVRYRREHWYNSAKFFDLEYTTAGWIPPGDRPHDLATWYQRVPGQPVTQRIVCKGDRVVGFNCVGSRWDHAVFLRWIQERRTLPWVLARMEEARFDEELSAPFRVQPGATITPAPSGSPAPSGPPAQGGA